MSKFANFAFIEARSDNIRCTVANGGVQNEQYLINEFYEDIGDIWDRAIAEYIRERICGSVGWSTNYPQVTGDLIKEAREIRKRANRAVKEGSGELGTVEVIPYYLDLATGIVIENFLTVQDLRSITETVKEYNALRIAVNCLDAAEDVTTAAIVNILGNVGDSDSDCLADVVCVTGRVQDRQVLERKMYERYCLTLYRNETEACCDSVTKHGMLIFSKGEIDKEQLNAVIEAVDAWRAQSYIQLPVAEQCEENAVHLGDLVKNGVLDAPLYIGCQYGTARPLFEEGTKIPSKTIKLNLPFDVGTKRLEVPFQTIGMDEKTHVVTVAVVESFTKNEKTGQRFADIEIRLTQDGNLAIESANDNGRRISLKNCPVSGLRPLPPNGARLDCKNAKNLLTDFVQIIKTHLSIVKKSGGKKSERAEKVKQKLKTKREIMYEIENPEILGPHLANALNSNAADDFVYYNCLLIANKLHDCFDQKTRRIIYKVCIDKLYAECQQNMYADRSKLHSTAIKEMIKYVGIYGTETDLATVKTLGNNSLYSGATMNAFAHLGKEHDAIINYFLKLSVEQIDADVLESIEIVLRRREPLAEAKLSKLSEKLESIVPSSQYRPWLRPYLRDAIQNMISESNGLPPDLIRKMGNALATLQEYNKLDKKTA